MEEARESERSKKEKAGLGNLAEMKFRPRQTRHRSAPFFSSSFRTHTYTCARSAHFFPLLRRVGSGRAAAKARERRARLNKKREGEKVPLPSAGVPYCSGFFLFERPRAEEGRKEGRKMDSAPKKSRASRKCQREWKCGACFPCAMAIWPLVHTGI